MLIKLLSYCNIFEFQSERGYSLKPIHIALFEALCKHSEQIGKEIYCKKSKRELAKLIGISLTNIDKTITPALKFLNQKGLIFGKFDGFGIKSSALKQQNYRKKHDS